MTLPHGGNSRAEFNRFIQKLYTQICLNPMGILSLGLTSHILHNSPHHPTTMASDSNGENARTLTPIRIVVGSDNAGHDYKEAIKKVLQSHAGVAEVLDVGVHDPSDSTAYPHPAVDACKKIKAGEVSIALKFCAFFGRDRKTQEASQLLVYVLQMSLILTLTLRTGRSRPPHLRYRSRRSYFCK
jgi:Ribose/Galactose Isomerase